MIRCPYCQTDNLVGAFFCSVCGANITALENETIKPIPASPLSIRSALHEKSHPAESKESYYVAIRTIDEGIEVALPHRGEITLGRIVDQQTMIPDIDLSIYQAYEKGVSRVHATLILQIPFLFVVDLNSANKTRINGNVIPPQVRRKLVNGDILTLGKLELQVIIQQL